MAGYRSILKPLFKIIFRYYSLVLFKMMTAFSCIIFLKIWTMVSNFKLIPYFNTLQKFVQNVRKPKWPSNLSWLPWWYQYFVHLSNNFYIQKNAELIRYKLEVKSYKCIQIFNHSALKNMRRHFIIIPVVFVLASVIQRLNALDPVDCASCYAQNWNPQSWQYVCMYGLF